MICGSQVGKTRVAVCDAPPPAGATDSAAGTAPDADKRRRWGDGAPWLGWASLLALQNADAALHIPDFCPDDLRWLGSGILGDGASVAKRGGAGGRASFGGVASRRASAWGAVRADAWQIDLPGRYLPDMPRRGCDAEFCAPDTCLCAGAGAVRPAFAGGRGPHHPAVTSRARCPRATCRLDLTISLRAFCALLSHSLFNRTGLGRSGVPT